MSNFITLNIDLSNIFVSGSSPGVTTGYTLLNGDDISTKFNPYVAGSIKYKKTGFLTSGGFDLSDLFSHQFTPLSIEGCCLWLDANDSFTMTMASNKVSQWRDKSPKGFNMTQTTSEKQPTYATNTLNACSTLYFSGSTFLYNNTNNLSIRTNSYSVFIVYKANDENSRFPYSKITYYNLGNAESVLLGRLYSAACRFYHAGIVIPDTGTPTDTTYQILELIVNRRAGVDYCYKNGSQLNQITYTHDETTDYNGGTPGLNPTLIGAYNSSSSTTITETWLLLGNIAEVVSFANPYDMTINTRQQIEGYFAKKWGLQSVLPSGHPYK